MSKRRELEQKQQTAERKQWVMIGSIIAAVAVVVIGGAILLSNNSSPTTSGRLMPAVKTIAAKVPAAADNKGKAWGPADAPLKIVEYLDYQCPACGAFHKSYEAGLETAFAGTGKVRYEFKPMPWVGTDESIDAGQASFCAADQNKFFEMHATVFENQIITGQENVGNYSKARLKEMAATVAGLDRAAFSTCLDNDTYKAAIQANRDEFDALTGSLQSRGTPFFLVNGKPFPQARTPEDFKKAFAEVAPSVTIP